MTAKTTGQGGQGAITQPTGSNPTPQNGPTIGNDELAATMGQDLSMDLINMIGDNSSSMPVESMDDTESDNEDAEGFENISTEADTQQPPTEEGQPANESGDNGDIISASAAAMEGLNDVFSEETAVQTDESTTQPDNAVESEAIDLSMENFAPAPESTDEVVDTDAASSPTDEVDSLAGLEDIVAETPTPADNNNAEDEDDDVEEALASEASKEDTTEESIPAATTTEELPAVEPAVETPKAAAAEDEASTNETLPTTDVTSEEPTSTEAATPIVEAAGETMAEASTTEDGIDNVDNTIPNAVEADAASDNVASPIVEVAAPTSENLDTSSTTADDIMQDATLSVGNENGDTEAAESAPQEISLEDATIEQSTVASDDANAEQAPIEQDASSTPESDTDALDLGDVSFVTPERPRMFSSPDGDVGENQSEYNVPEAGGLPEVDLSAMDDLNIPDAVPVNLNADTEVAAQTEDENARNVNEQIMDDVMSEATTDVIPQESQEVVDMTMTDTVPNTEESYVETNIETPVIDTTNDMVQNDTAQMPEETIAPMTNTSIPDGNIYEAPVAQAEAGSELASPIDAESQTSIENKLAAVARLSENLKEGGVDLDSLIPEVRVDEPTAMAAENAAAAATSTGYNVATVSQKPPKVIANKKALKIALGILGVVALGGTGYFGYQVMQQYGVIPNGGTEITSDEIIGSGESIADQLSGTTDSSGEGTTDTSGDTTTNEPTDETTPPDEGGEVIIPTDETEFPGMPADETIGSDQETTPPETYVSTKTREELLTIGNLLVNRSQKLSTLATTQQNSSAKLTAVSIYQDAVKLLQVLENDANIDTLGKIEHDMNMVVQRFISLAQRMNGSTQ